MAATDLRRGDILCNSFFRSSFQNAPVNELLKSVHICQRYHKRLLVYILWLTIYIGYCITARYWWVRGPGLQQNLMSGPQCIKTWEFESLFGLPINSTWHVRVATCVETWVFVCKVACVRVGVCVCMHSGHRQPSSPFFGRQIFMGIWVAEGDECEMPKAASMRRVWVGVILAGDLWERHKLQAGIVLSGRLSQIVCKVTFSSAMFWSFVFILLNS